MLSADKKTAPLPDSAKCTPNCSTLISLSFDEKPEKKPKEDEKDKKDDK